MNRSQVVHYLVENGADIEIANRHGHTCLMIAAYKGHEDIVQFLLERGAHIDRRSKKGARLALCLSFLRGHHRCRHPMPHYSHTLHSLQSTLLPPTLLDKQYPHITLHDLTYFMSRVPFKYLCSYSKYLSFVTHTPTQVLYCIVTYLYNTVYSKWFTDHM